MGGTGSGRYPAKRYKAPGYAMDQLGKVVPRAIRFVNRALDPKNPDDIPVAIRWACSQWVLEKATGKPRQEIAVHSQELVQVEIRIIGADGETLGSLDDAIDGESHEITDG